MLPFLHRILETKGHWTAVTRKVSLIDSNMPTLDNHQPTKQHTTVVIIYQH